MRAENSQRSPFAPRPSRLPAYARRLLLEKPVYTSILETAGICTPTVVGGARLHFGSSQWATERMTRLQNAAESSLLRKNRT